jgi:peptidoglycan/xylan/chitin deacetylase (PgdA/CDA1 family)
MGLARMKMNNAIKRFISYPFYKLRSSRIAKENNFRILLYHSIGQEIKGDKLGLQVSEENFLRQMDFLYKNDFRVFKLKDLVNRIISKECIQPRSVVITFDDGYRNVLTKAAPILQKFHYHAAVFITTEADKIKMLHNDGREYWKDWDFLSMREILELQKMGHDIGAHSTDFLNLKYMNHEQAYRRIIGSRKMLEEGLSKKIEYFSYPSGGVNKEIKNILNKLGFKAAVCSLPGYNDRSADLFMLRRMEINNWDNFIDFKLKLMGYYNWVILFKPELYI